MFITIYDTLKLSGHVHEDKQLLGSYSHALTSYMLKNHIKKKNRF